MSKTSQSSSAKDLAYIAVFTALTIVLGFIPPIPAGPLGVPILVQNLGIILMGMVLGARRGTLSALLFIALACTGLPILAGGRSGLVAITSPLQGSSSDTFQQLPSSDLSAAGVPDVTSSSTFWLASWEESWSIMPVASLE